MDPVTERMRGSGTGGAGLGVKPTRLALIGVWLLNLTYGFFVDDFGLSNLMWVPYVTALVGTILLTHQGEGYLSIPYAVGVAACAVVTSFAVVWHATPSGHIWIYSFASYLAALLVARGNAIIGGVGGLLVFVVGALWLTGLDADVSGYAAVLGVPITAMFVGYVWRATFRWMVTQERQHRSSQNRALQAEIFATEATARTRKDLDDIRLRVIPVLHPIIEGEEIGDVLHTQLSIVESTIRDRIRSPGLSHPLLDATILASRVRGVQILLLGEKAEVTSSPQSLGGFHELHEDAPIDDVLVTAICNIISQSEPGEIVVVRLLPVRDDAVVSVVIRKHLGDALHVRLLSNGSVE